MEEGKLSRAFNSCLYSIVCVCGGGCWNLDCVQVPKYFRFGFGISPITWMHNRVVDSSFQKATFYWYGIKSKRRYQGRFQWIFWEEESQCNHLSSNHHLLWSSLSNHIRMIYCRFLAMPTLTISFSWSWGYWVELSLVCPFLHSMYCLVAYWTTSASPLALLTLSMNCVLFW